MPKQSIPRLKGSKIELPPDYSPKIKMTYSVEESVFADLKRFHIRPSVVIDRELRREIRRRKKELRLKEKRQILNRYSGEVLSQ